jgi:hypothetical protein
MRNVTGKPVTDCDIHCTGARPFDRQGIGLGQRCGALLPGDCPACLPAEAVPSSDAAQLLLLERNMT